MTLCVLSGRQLHLWPAARSASADNPGRPTSGPATRAAVTAIRADTFDGGPPEEMSAIPPATPVEVGQLPGPAAPHVHRHRRNRPDHSGVSRATADRPSHGVPTRPPESLTLWPALPRAGSSKRGLS